MEGTRRNARRGRNKISVKREAPGESFDNEYGIQKHWKPSVKQEQPSTDTDTGEMCGGQFMPNASVKSEVEEWGRDSDSGIVEESLTDFSNKLLKEQELELESDSGISEEYAAQASTQSGHTQSHEDMLLEKEIVWQFTEDTYSTCDPLAIDEEQQDEMQLEVPTKEEQEEEEEQEQELDYDDVADGGNHYEDFQMERGTLPPPYWGPRVLCGLPSADPPPDGYAAPPPDPFLDGYAAPPPDPFPDGYAAVPPDPPTRSVCENLRQYRCLVCERWFTSSSHLTRHYKTAVHQQTAIKKGVPAVPSHKKKRQRSAAPETPPPSECVGSSPDGTKGDRGKQPELRPCAAPPPLPEAPPLQPLPQPPPEASPAQLQPPEASPAQLQPPESSPAQLQPPESSPAQLQPPESSPAQLQPPESSPAQLQPPEAPPPRLQPPEAHPPQLPPPKARPPQLQPPEVYPPRLPPPGAHLPQLPSPGAYPPQLPPPGAHPPLGVHPNPLPPPLPSYIGNSYAPQVRSPAPQLPGVPQPTSDGRRATADELLAYCTYSSEWQQHTVPGPSEAQFHRIPGTPAAPEHALALRVGQGALRSQQAVCGQHEVLQEQHGAYLQHLLQQRQQLLCALQLGDSSLPLSAPAVSARGSSVTVVRDNCGIGRTAGKTVSPLRNAATNRKGRQVVHGKLPLTIREKNTLCDSAGRSCQAPPLPESLPVTKGSLGFETVVLPQHLDKLQSQYSASPISAPESVTSPWQSLRVNEAGDSPDESTESVRRCPVCGGGFSGKYSLRNHVRCFHPDTEYFECGHCGGAFAVREEYRAHLAEHGAGVDVTELRPSDGCQKRFTNATHPIRCRRQYTGERPYLCDVCFKGYPDKRTLAVHLKQVHSGERPYCCDQCPLRFAQKATLNRHKRQHSDERPYACHVCDVCFVRKDNMVVHIKKHYCRCSLCVPDAVSERDLVSHQS